MRLSIFIVLASALLSPTSLIADELDAALSKINQVGAKATGAEAARTAWQNLAQAKANQIPKLLSAINDENPLAANYIRSAVEAIAEREPDNLPADALEAYVLQTSHNPRSRRLAYELLLRVEPEAEARLLGKMLNDPSVELRRDAVALLINQKHKQQDQEVTTLRSALDAAVDDDQVKEISKRLKTLGEEVDVARHYGFVMQWHVIGPFENTDGQGFDKPRGPEGQPIDLSATYKASHGEGEVQWQEVVSDDDYGRVDINKALGKHKDAISYAVAKFESDQARPVELRWKSKNACKVWLNGQLVDQREVYHSDGSPPLDQYTCQGQLKQGENTILLKVCQNDQDQSWAQDWAFQLRVCDSVGAAVLAENR